MRKVLVFIGFFLSFLFFAKVSHAQVVINEFLPNPDSGNEWVEFYNIENYDIDLSGYYFDDDPVFDSDSGTSVKIMLEGVIPSHSTCYWDLNTYLNNVGDVPTIFKTDTSLVDTYSYSSSILGKTYSRVPDGGDWASDQIPTKSLINCKSLVLQTPTPTPAPTGIATSTSRPKSTYKINEAKSNDGTTLSSAEVYVNGDYTHHYAPEEFDFCDSGCDYGYGVYKFTVKKSGYENWEVEDDIGPGESYEADPVLKKSTTSAPAVSTPTLTPKSTVNSSPTPKPTIPPDPYITIVNDGEENSEGDVLGISENNSPTPEADSNNKKSQRILSWTLIVLGIGVLSASGYYFYRNIKTDKNNDS